MEIFGDIERFVATNLYPLRVPIGIALGVVVLAVLYVAWRRRWDLAARRNPRRTLAILVPALLVGIPLTWYLGSPLFISTQIVEQPVAGGSVVSFGSFLGSDEFHFGSGTASVVASADGSLRVRLDDFAVRNGPDLFVYITPDSDGDIADGVELGALKADTGSFEYILPPGTDPGAIGSIVIWCKQFAVLFAHAPVS